ncbi:serine hydrolase domain-containing protein [Bacteroidota bacterium]
MKQLLRNRIQLIIILIITVQSANAQDTLDMVKIEKGVDEHLTYFSNENPGAVVAVVKKGNLIFNKAYGLSNVQEKEIMTIDKLFNIRQLTKSFTAVAVLQLVEKNKINLEDNLKYIFPDFPEYGKKVMIRNLLNHTSCLPNYNEETIYTNDQVLTFLKNQNGTDKEPGVNWKYSNSDYVMLALIIEEVSGQSYKDYLKKKIFNKLSMNNTWFVDEINNKNIAESHYKENDKYVIRKENKNIYGEQGIYTNSTDFAKWDKALYSDKLLSCEYLTKIFSVEQNKFGNKSSFYNYGWERMERYGIKYYWHGGSQGGYTNLVFHLPDNQTTVLILTNRNDGYNLLRMTTYIAKLFDKLLMLRFR